MKGEFSHSIDLENLANYCLKGGWLGLEQGWTREGLVYRTKSGSAKMTLTPNQGVYEGQRSLLFSHGVFSWITKEWLEGKLDFYYWESSTGQHPMEYYGRCYMRGLRDEVARKFLIISPNNEEYQELLGGWEILDILDTDVDEKTIKRIRKEIEVLYKGLLSSRGKREEYLKLKEEYDHWTPPVTVKFCPFKGLGVMLS